MFTVLSNLIVVVVASILAHQLIKDFRGKWFLRFLILLPWAAPVALSDDRLALDLRLALLGDQLGARSHLHLVDQFNPPQWLGQPNLALAAITTVHAWRLIPFATVIMIAGLASIPREIDDASHVDGATGLKKLWYVTLPLQLPIAIIAVLFGIVFTATDMAVVYILTQRRPVQQHPDAPDVGLRDRHPVRRARRRRRRRALPAAGARARHGPDAASSRSAWRSPELGAGAAAENAIAYAVVAPVRDRARLPVLLDALDRAQDRQDLYNMENVPFWFADGSPTLHNVRFLFEETDYMTLAREHRAGRRASWS